MKSVAGHQPNLYPYGGFFAKLASADEFVIADSVQYVKKEFHNRNRIKFPDGTAKWLSIPVKNSGRYKQLIKDVEIDGRSGWRRDHRRSIELNYRKAAHFDEFFPTVAGLLDSEWKMLAEFNVAFIRATAAFLGIGTPVTLASEKGIEGDACPLIAEICRKTGSSTYLHGIHGLDYVDFAFLEEKGVASLIQIFECPIYPQLHGEFIPNLSILDMIFNCGRERTLGLLREGSKILSRDEALKHLGRQG